MNGAEPVFAEATFRALQLEYAGEHALLWDTLSAEHPELPEAARIEIFRGLVRPWFYWATAAAKDPKILKRAESRVKESRGHAPAREVSLEITVDDGAAGAATTPAPDVAPPEVKAPAAPSPEAEALGDKYRLVQIAQTGAMASRIWDRLHFSPRAGDNLQKALELFASWGIEDKSVLRPTMLRQDCPQVPPDDFTKFVLALPYERFVEFCQAVDLATAAGNLTRHEFEWQAKRQAKAGVR